MEFVVTRCAALLFAALAGACVDGPGVDEVDSTETTRPFEDDVSRYLDDRAYRREVLELALTEHDNLYAGQRLSAYAVEGGWDTLPERDPPSASVLVDESVALAAGELEFPHARATTLSPARLPESRAEWIALGERVFFEYPAFVQPRLRALIVADQAEALGFLIDDGAYVGMRIIADEHGLPQFAGTCAGCHAGRVDDGPVSGVLANRNFDVGAQVLLVLGDEPPTDDDVDATNFEHLAALGPGRSDVTYDDSFNPYAFPDWGGLADLPYLHHTANWLNLGVAPLAIRVETVFITATHEQARIPRVLAWALAEYIRSLPPPPPVIANPDPAAFLAGQAVFEAAACAGCHVPPLYTSDRRVTVAEIGTDSAAGLSPARGTGYYRIPSLRGVGRTAPYLHHGAFADLEAMFDPQRDEPGHQFGLDLDSEHRAALLYFLRCL